MIINYLKVFFVSMLPLVELRLAIPLSQSLGLPTIPSYAVAILGNMLPVPFIYLFARKILIWGSERKHLGTFFKYCLSKGEKAGQKLQSKAGRGLFMALFLFVAIPLPGTGAWTGTLAASILDFDFKRTTIACMCGVLAAGVLMMVLSKAVIFFL